MQEQSDRLFVCVRLFVNEREICIVIGAYVKRAFAD